MYINLVKSTNRHWIWKSIILIPSLPEFYWNVFYYPQSTYTLKTVATCGEESLTRLIKIVYVQIRVLERHLCLERE
jgi:hypothetical protein